MLAWLLAGAIAKIYVTNMTLMLRPEVWGQMYATTAGGSHLPPHDPTVLPRWLFMMAGGLWVSGIWMIWLAGRRVFEEPVRKYLAANGGRLAVVMLIAQAMAAAMVLRAQPQAIRDALAADPLAHCAGLACLGIAVLIAMFGVWAAVKQPLNRAAGWLGAALVLVGMLSRELSTSRTRRATSR